MAENRKYPDQYLLRMPEGLRERIARVARANGRSLNSEIVELLLEYYPPELELEDLINHVESLLDYALNNDWRDNRKFLVEGLKELLEKVKAETGPLEK